MNPQGKKRRKGGADEEFGVGEPRAARATSGAPRGARSRSVLFILSFLGLLVLFQVLFELWFARSAPFATYMHWNAAACAMVLRWLGEPAQSTGDMIHSPRYALTIGKGCDAIQPTAIFVAAVLALPARRMAKLI